MADISLLFDVAGGDLLTGESGKRINDQLTEIVRQINQNPFKIKFEADDKSLEKLKKEIEGIRELIGDGGILKIESSDLSGMSKSINQISDMLMRMMGAVGQNSVKLNRFGEQLQNIFEAIPDNGNMTARSIQKITDSFSDLVDKVDELNVTVDQINNKRFGSTINIGGAVQESTEQIQAYREYLLALIKDFNGLQEAYRFLQANITNPKYSIQAFTANAAVSANKRLLENIQSFNYEDVKAQAGIMDLGQLKQAVELYQSLITSMMSIRTQSGAIFAPGKKADRAEIEAARQKIQEVEQSLNHLENAPSGENAGDSIFDFVDRIREGLETLHDPIGAVKSQIDSLLDFSNVSAESEEALKSRLTELTDAIGKLFSDLRGKIAEELNYSTLSDEGDKALIERIRTECTTIEDRFDQLRDKIVSVFDMSEVPFDVSSITDKVDQIQESLNGLTLTIGNVQTGGGSAPKLVTDKRNLKDLIPDGVKISDTVSEKMLDGITAAMQSMQIAESDAGTLANLFKNLSGTVTEVTTKIIDQGAETERLKNVTIKGVDEAGQAFTRSADYILKHSKKEGDYIEGHVTTTRKQVIAEQERAGAVKKTTDEIKTQTGWVDDLDESIKQANEESKKIFEQMHKRDEQMEKNAESQRLEDLERGYEQYARQMEEAEEAAERLARTQASAFDKSEDAAERAREKAEAEANSLERRNKLLKDADTLLAQIRNKAKAGGGQSGELDDMGSVLSGYQDALREGVISNDSFAVALGNTRARLSELKAEFAGAAKPARILRTESTEFAEAAKNIQGSIGNARNALENFTAAENSSNESSRVAYKGLEENIRQLDALNSELAKGSLSEDDFKARLAQINGEIKKNTNTIRENGDAHKSLGEGIKKTIQNFSQWLGVSRIMMAAVRSVKQMVSAVIELDTAMTELRKVTDETEARYDKFLNDAASRAKQVGASLSDTVTATADFARLGYTVDQAEKLADAAIIYKNVGDGISDINEASESIIATMQAFAIKPEDVMSIVDKFNDVGNKFAISSGGVGEALLRSAAAMQSANNTLDETIALATAANKIVQNPQIVGTTLKTVSMFLRAAKTEAQEAGEETDGMAESVSKLRGEILALTGNKVDIQIDENTFKSTYQILKELSEVWEELTDVSQANILERIGGKRNANVVSALLTNFSEAERALEVSTNSVGSAIKENEKMLASIQGRINLFKASFEDLSRTIVDGDLVKFVIDSGTWLLNLVSGIGKLINSFGGLKTIAIAVSGALLSMNINSIVAGFGKLGGSIRDVLSSGAGLKALFTQLATQGVSLSTGIGLVTTALTAAFAIYSRVKQAERERRAAAIESAKSAAENSNAITSLTNSYIELSKSIEDDEGAKDKLRETTNELLKRLGVEESYVEGLAERYGDLTEAVRRASAEALRSQRVDLVSGYQAAVDDLIDAANTFETISGVKYRSGKLTNNERSAISEIKQSGLGRADGQYLYVNYEIESNNGKVDTPEEILSLYENMNKVLQLLEDSSDGDLYKHLYNKYQSLGDEVSAYIDVVALLNDNLLDMQYIQSILGKEIPETKEEFDTLRDTFIRSVQDSGKYVSSLKTVEDAVDDVLKSAPEFSKFYNDISLSDTGNAVSAAVSQRISDFDDFKMQIGTLGAALGEFQEQGNVSSETYRKLAEADEKYKDLFTITGNGIELQTDKLNTYVESLEQEYGAKMALNGATSDEIGVMMALGNTLVTVAEETGDVVSEITELRGYIDSMNDGTQLSVEETDKLIKKYPKLESAVRKAEKGYQIEISALEDLIAIKAEYIRLTEQETAVTEARNALNLYNNGNTTATVKINEIFSKYEELHGKAITSFEEFKEGYEEVFGRVFEGAYEAYEKYVEALIGENQGLALAAQFAEDAVSGMAEGFVPEKIKETTASVSDLTSELEGLTKNLKELNEGTEYSTGEIITLLTKYPSLRDHIIKTANGYKIETSAIRELIAAKVQLITTTDQEARLASARATLVSSTKDANAEKADTVFADYLAKNGKNIETIEEYKAAYKAYYGYAAKASLAYAQAKIDAFADAGMDAIMVDLYNDYIGDNYKEGYRPDTSSSSTSSSSDVVESEFEKAYKLHQHYLAMDQETEEQYINWLEGAYQAFFAKGEDDYNKYEEEVYEKRKQLFSTSLDEMQHQIDLLSHQLGDTSAEQIAIYEQMQKKVNAQANAYRARGIKENDELIRELQNQWWQYEDSIRQLRESSFSDWLSDQKFIIEQLKLDNAGTDKILGSWRTVLRKINDEIAYYSSKGYDITTDVIQNLMNELKSAKEAMIAELDDVVAKANEVVDGFQDVYTTLTNAAKEYASTGYLSVDSLQAILALGPKYMTMLDSENGQLIINEQSLQKIIAARTDEMAAETALSYAKQVLLATEQDEVQTLRDLAGIQASSASNIWEQAYATLGYARALGAAKGISDSYYASAIENVEKMQSVSKTAADTISNFYETLNDGYVSQAEGLETILKLTEDMIKQENSDRIDALENEKVIYKDIIDEKKEILRLTKEQDNHDRDMADKLKEIADLQSKIDQLALDDSREARAQRSKLEAQLLEKQKSLADDQADYAYDAQVDALDKQYDAFEDEKNDEIAALKKELSSAEKLYQAAIDRIENGWDSLYDDLITWNYNYGSTLQKDLQNAWDAALAAAERYGSFVEALDGVKSHTSLGADSSDKEAARAAVASGANGDYIVNRMRANSLAWFGTADNAKRSSLNEDNRGLAEDYRTLTGTALSYRNGAWYRDGSSSPLYQLTPEEVGHTVVSAMKQNSALWGAANEDTRRKLEKANETLAGNLANFLGARIVKTGDGVWMIGGERLYDKYHSGGVVGGGTVKQNEVMALLKKGEAVLDERREAALYKTVDFVQVLSEKIGHAIDKGRISSLLGGTGRSFPAMALPTLAGGVGTMNFAPTVQVTIAGAGDLNESTARKYGSIAADTVLDQLKSAFTQRGVSASGNSILK